MEKLYRSSEHVDLQKTKVNISNRVRSFNNKEKTSDNGNEKELEKKEEKEENENGWFAFDIRNILEPKINKESLSDLISTNYTTFNQSNVGLFDMFESLLVKANIHSDSQNGENDASTNNYNEASDRIHYEFINHVICSINKELSVNIEMEALKMIKIYNTAYNEFKNEIDFRDEVYQDILNEAKDYATLIFDEKAGRNKRIHEIDFLVLMNVNFDNYKCIIGSQCVSTPKMKLEELFKITVV